jgi:uncharacterized membrane protein
MGRLTRYFFNGLAVLVPVVATIYIVYIVFVKIDRLFGFQIPGLGFAMTITLITLIGFATSNFLTRRAIRLIDHIFSRLPLVKMIYTAIKDLIGAFVGDKKGFNKPVSVAISPGSPVRVIGFVTNESLSSLGLKDSVAVYLPQSYNFAGNLIVVPREQITPIDADGSTVMAFIVSGGISAKT